MALIPFLVMPALIAGSWVLAARLKTAHPSFSRAWLLAGLPVGFLAAAVGAGIPLAPQWMVSAFLLLGFVAYAGTVVLFGQAWSGGSDHPIAVWITAASFGSGGLLSVVLMRAFGRGIALADAGQSSWVVDALILASAIGIPILLLVGLLAFLETKQEQRPTQLVR
ncbi:hypothetical protein [Arthrobacter pityocampae]|uniref:hypothetical protein n=1 Tax=Arthrobacter pityocampae TaxID=547334 RepID=UPI0037357571